MQEIPRIGPGTVRERMKDPDADTVLACAYDDEDKCRSLRLEGALTRGELKAALPELDKRSEIVFYCA